MEIEWKGHKLKIEPLTVNDLIEFEEATGLSLRDMNNKLTLGGLRKLIWLGMRKSLPDITEKEVGDLGVTSKTWGDLQSFLLIEGPG
jgi:hypothetical protein